MPGKEKGTALKATIVILIALTGILLTAEFGIRAYREVWPLPKLFQGLRQREAAF